MQFRGILFACALLLTASTLVQAQDAPPAPAGEPIIRTETKLVLVDVVVTDKKGGYVSDLSLKDFKVWEDNKEQSLKTFQFGADPATPQKDRQRYMVLFFDNSTMDTADQLRARQEAGKFIDKNAGPDRLMAIVNFGGGLQVAQNFTDDAERLKQVVSGVKFSAVNPNATRTSGRIGGAEAEFGTRTVLLGLRNLAKRLADVPGRKSLVMFTAGFRQTVETQPEVTAAIDACNRANVAIYPIDVRGLAVPDASPFPFGTPRVMNLPPQGIFPAALRSAGIAMAADPLLEWASLLLAYLPEPDPQGRGGGGGSTGGGGAPAGGGGGAPSGGGGASSGGGGGGGGRGGATGAAPSGGSPGGFGGRGGASVGGNTGNPGGFNGRGGANNGVGNGGGGNNPGGLNGRNFPVNPERVIVPTIPDTISTNQQILYQLATGTGGFVILNTNDLLGGLEKIGKEQNQYYIVGYTPPESKEGDCHVLRVKVNRGGTNWRARTGYCNSKGVDVLAGKPIEKTLESQATGTAPGSIKASMSAPYFYTAADTARVNVAIDLPGKDIKFEKVKGKMHAEFNVLGIAYRANANVAARFSDTVKLDFEDKKEVEKFAEKPYHYENQFDLASGQYTLKVAFSAASDSFGKLESPLNIDPYDGKMFMVSALAVSKSFHRVAEVETNMDAALLEGRAPLVAGAYQFEPSGGNGFKTTETVGVYFEVYDPKLTEETPPAMAVQMKILDRATGGAPKVDSGGVDVKNFVRKGNPLVPVGLKVPVNLLPAGGYRLEITAMDSAGRTMVRSADFDVI